MSAEAARRPQVVRSLLAVGGMLLLYACAPVPGRVAPPLLSWVGVALGVGVLTWVTVALVRLERRATDGDGVRTETVIALLYAFIALFSLTYLGLSTRPGEFEGMHTRVDALYFTTSTLATVGYGDVHATGQAARAVATVQMFLDLVFLAAAARLLASALARHRQAGSPGTGEVQGAAPQEAETQPSPPN